MTHLIKSARIIHDDEPSNPGWFVRFTAPSGGEIDAPMTITDPEASAASLRSAALDEINFVSRATCAKRNMSIER